MLAAVLYAAVPVGVFFLGWLKLPLAVLLCAVLMFGGYKIYGGLRAGKANLINKYTRVYWLVTAAVSAVWVYLSGIGSYVYQNTDYWARNPLFRDLSTYSWPVIYDFSTQTETVQQILGSGKAALAYYYTWWLPVAGVSKLFHLGEPARNFLLYLWAFLGVMLILYCINRALGRCTWAATVIFMIFGGLDIIGYFIFYRTVPLTDHIEWWAWFAQYSSDTTQLFWVFNQSIPVWLIVGLLLQLKDNKYMAAVSSLTFAYSPWATFGMIPLALGGGFLKEKNGWKNIFNPANILLPAAMLLGYGFLYMASSGSEGGVGMIFAKYPDLTKMLLRDYVMFVVLEFGIYFLIMGKSIRSYHFYWVALAELLLIPLFYVRDGNFVMRASIPALFLLMIFCIRFLTDKSVRAKWRKAALILVLIVGTYAAFVEINRTVILTAVGANRLQEDVYSFGAIRTEDETLINSAKTQFFIYDYEDTFFFRYLAKEER